MDLEERSECCNALLDKDATGDRVCIACGTIADNYPTEKEDTGDRDAFKQRVFEEN